MMIRVLCVFTIAMAAMSGTMAGADDETTKPNFIVVFCDDQGYLMMLDEWSYREMYQPLFGADHRRAR